MITHPTHNILAVVGRLFAAVAVVAATLAVTAAPSGANTVGNTEACTPGYWKNHTDNWLESPGVVVPTTKTLGSVFAIPASLSHLRDVTFLEALNWDSFGKTADGPARNLLKHAVAAWLNAAYDDGTYLQYPLQRSSSSAFYPAFPGIRHAVNAALLGSSGDMLSLKDFFDGIANDLPCPLS